MKEIWNWDEFTDLSKKQQTGCFKFDDGDIAWYKDGELHRLDGPAIKWDDGTEDWYKDGELHRLDGPAFEYVDGHKEWWIEGKQYTEEEFKIKAFAILNGLEKFL